MSPDLHVLRLASVFEPPDAALAGDGVRFDPIGGMQNHTAQLTRALDRRGVRQTVVTARPPGAPARAPMGQRATVVRHGLRTPWLRQLYAPGAARSAARAAPGVDLVHAHVGEDLAVLPIALRAAHRAGAPLVVTVHTSLRHTFTPAGLRSRLLKLFGGRIEHWACGRAAGVVVLTPRLARRVTDGGIAPERIHVIPSGVVPADFAAALDDPFAARPRPRVLFLGRLARQKGVETLVEAAGLLREPAEVLIVGDGPLRGRLEAAVARNGLSDRVHFAGFRPHHEVAAILRHADVFTAPSRYEELGTVLLEAMAAGRPIVASRTGGIPHAVGDAARLVAPGDARALARAIDDLLADRTEAARLGALAHERAGRFDWEALAGQVLDVYRLALGRDPGAEPAPAARLHPVGA
jgi:glycosyltransferase involved in cell wall biosynthesis